MKHKVSLLLLALCFTSTNALASVIDWTDWESATTGTNGSASGTVGGVGISYTGHVAFAQTGTGINYWTEGTPAPYTGNSVVDNAPTASELIAMSAHGTTQTITFSQAVTDPIMAIVSMGQSGLPVTYDFDTAFTVLSEGRGYWGDGSYTTNVGDSLTGRELHGAIQFVGTFTTISWETTTSEFWHGFTIGVAQTAVPEPSTFALCLLGFIALLSRKKIRSKQVVA